MRISEAFKAYGATLKNINWSVSAENDAGELVVSIWQHHFKKAVERTICCSDKVSRWTGHGNKELRVRIEKAFESNQDVRVVIAKTNNEKAVEAGQDASKLKNTFSIKKDWIGKVTLWDGENYEIEFKFKQIT